MTIDATFDKENDVLPRILYPVNNEIMIEFMRKRLMKIDAELGNLRTNYTDLSKDQLKTFIKEGNRQCFVQRHYNRSWYFEYLI